MRLVEEGAKMKPHTIPHHNLTKTESSALKNLSLNPTIVICPADKGGAVVVLEYAYYKSEILSQLEDSQVYTKLPDDPLPRHKLKIDYSLSNALAHGWLDEPTHRFLTVEHPVCPIFYTLPKIHGNCTTLPGQPIVSARGSLLQPVAQFLDYWQQPCTLITSNVLRVESEETIVVDTQGQNTDFIGDIQIHDFPQKRILLAQAKINVNSGNQYLGTTKIKIPSAEFLKEPKKKQYVSVAVKSTVCNIEKVVLVSFHSGYIFVQTDKTIYTPGSKVYYRLYMMNYKLQPVSKAVTVEFVSPGGVLVQRETRRHDSKSGIISLSYQIPEVVSVGVWTVAASYEDSPYQNYTTNFEVKEYVLPSFEIQLVPVQSFFYIDDNDFRVDIHANYLYGKPVNGKAFVVFGLKQGNDKKAITESLRRVEINNGDGHSTLERKDLVKYFQNPNDMLQFTLYVTVTVITDSGSDMVEAELENIYIVTSPYKILFTKTSKYFKPGMPFSLMVFVTNPDGSPANRIPVVANPGNVQGITQKDGTTRLTLNTGGLQSSLQISVKTAHPALPEGRQASSTMTATAYKPLYGQNFLHISISASELKPDDNLNVHFNIRNSDGVQNQIPHFTYLILNKGRIAQVDRVVRQVGQSLVTLSLPIRDEFIPSFRIVAYYVAITPSGREIVSDSVWVDVEDTCMGTLEVMGDKDADKRIQRPSTSMKLRVRADHKANVGFVAVDKGVFVLNKKFKISQNKVWDSVENTDIGCTPGSGENSMGVFYDAGLALQTSFKMTTLQRSEPVCAVHGNRKRRSSVALIEHKTTKASNYKDLERQCCLDGMQENPMGHSCERRIRLIQEGPSCKAAFLDCCKYIEKKRETEKKLKEDDPLGRSDEDDEYISDAAIVSRTEFPESWFWKVEQMIEKPDANGISEKVLNVLLKDSITTWEILAVSLSENKGICIAKPHEIQVMMDFFIDLKLPYSVVRNEQVEIRAILYNYRTEDLNLRVEFSYNDAFCSLATAKKKYRRDVKLKGSSSMAIPFIIVPLKLGHSEIEVKAAGRFVSDGVKKKLWVVPEGMRLQTYLKSVTLEPEVKGKGGVQEEEIKALRTENVVPKTEISTIVTIQGTPITQMVEKALDGANLNHLIIMPWGCGEQNMMSMTPGVIATHYLDATNQWDRVGVDRRAQAIQFIITGYTRQLSFRTSENSFTVNPGHAASTWLTAYVAKVFAMAQSLVEIDSNVLCGAVKWLILKKQKPDGIFVEEATVYHQEMMGGISGSSEPAAALTAFVLTALLESQKTCNDYVNTLQLGIDKATRYLQTTYQSLKKPYTIALTSYALARGGNLQDTRKLMSASTDNNRWITDSRFISLEATSYALLTLLYMKQFDYAVNGPIVRWLNEERYYGEAFGSTQATIVMFQALAEYQKVSPTHNELNLDVTFHLPGRSNPNTIRVNLDNALVARSETTKENRDFVVKAKGKGQGTLTVMSVYYAIVTEKERKCNFFDLSVTVKEELLVNKPDDVKKIYSLTICTRFLKSEDATMSILDISMMTGFSPDVQSLNKLKRGVDKYISNFEINKGGFEKSTLIIYLDKVSHSEPDCLKFNIHQQFEVGLIQPGSITVYDYNTPENRCTKFYHVEEGSSLLGKICMGEVCRCAEANCFMQQQVDVDITAGLRLEKACEPGVDYVYKVTLLEIQPGDNYDKYVMQITKVIKEGTDEAPEGNRRNFISHAKCRKSLDMKIGRDYLTWGISIDLWPQPSGIAYIITKDTWFEWWPNERECQDPQHQDLCNDFDVFSEELDLNGCPN
ncbi:A.superbus venom factor 1-like [Rhinophrynus dorsalis]